MSTLYEKFHNELHCHNLGIFIPKTLGLAVYIVPRPILEKNFRKGSRRETTGRVGQVHVYSNSTSAYNPRKLPAYLRMEC